MHAHIHTCKQVTSSAFIHVYTVANFHFSSKSGQITHYYSIARQLAFLNTKKFYMCPIHRESYSKLNTKDLILNTVVGYRSLFTKTKATTETDFFTEHESNAKISVHC